MTVDQTAAWRELDELYWKQYASVSLKELFERDPGRADRYSVELNGMLLDYSKQRVDDQVLEGLFALAEQQQLADWIRRLLAGEPINNTEGRPAWHTACRMPASESGPVQAEVQAELGRMERLVYQIRNGQWFGYSGKAVNTVVNIGVGGSDLGPLMITHALQNITSKITVHFVSSIDGTQISHLMGELDPERTLFVFASKTFTTIDTLSNAQTALDWLLANCDDRATVLEKHFIGVSANAAKMSEWGIAEANQVRFWDWVGGRYSMWSAIGLPIAIALGMDHFRAMLEGAHAMDRHFAEAPLRQNMPVVMGLINVWNINFLDIRTRTVLPYDSRLKYLPSYLQQLIMESNGKSVTREGEPVGYKTCPIIWGEVGPNAQHAFFQLLHQGTQTVAADFLLPISRDDYDFTSETPVNADVHLQHDLAVANCLAQSRVMMLGDAAIPAALQQQFDNDHKHYPGNQPSNTLLLPDISPRTMGMLIALYEHITFVESVIWEINAFDQWGVELGKKIAESVRAVATGQASDADFDGSTRNLLARFRRG